MFPWFGRCTWGWISSWKNSLSRPWDTETSSCVSHKVLGAPPWCSGGVGEGAPRDCGSAKAEPCLAERTELG